MRTKHLQRAVALTMSLALVGAACGDDDGTASADTGAEVADTAAEDTVAEGEAASDGMDRSDWPDSLVFGAVPSEESTALEESYDPIIEILEQELDLDVEFFQATDYAGIIEAQIAGRLDLAQYGPFSYVIARVNGAEIDPVGAMIDEPGAEPGYQSYGIAPADSDIDSIEDFAGRTVCYVDPGSTSGYLYPSAGLIDAGIDPDSGITPIFAGGHDASVISVHNGDCEAGFAFDAMVDTITIESGDVPEGAIKTVWKSEVIAGSPLAVRTDLPESLVSEIRRIINELANEDHLLEVGICEDECRLTDEGVWGYAEVSDDFYDGVRAVCEATKAEACEG